MSAPHKATPEQLDYAICEYLRQYDGQATNNDGLIQLAGGKWRAIDARIQAMRKSGRIRWHGRSRKNHPEGVKAHGWEVVK
jgi:hypothetical protein